MPFIVDWYPEYWTPLEKEELFTFWRNKYFYNKINISLSDEPCGGNGYFDSELASYDNITTQRSVVDELHPINIAYNVRKNELEDELQESQEEDQFRILLLLQAEKASYDYWKYKNIYNINSNYPNHIKKIIQSKIENLLFIFKDTFAQLMEYDRENNNPITDPDRDLFKTPPTVFEYRRWLTRGNRIVDMYSKEEKLLKKMWLETRNKDIPVYKESFLPTYLEKKHFENKELDIAKGIERNTSGFSVKNNNDTGIKIKPPVPLILSRLSSIADSVSDFKIIQEDIRPEVEEINLDENTNPFYAEDKIDLPLENPYPNLNADSFKGLRTDEEFEYTQKEEKIVKKIEDILSMALQTPPKEDFFETEIYQQTEIYEKESLPSEEVTETYISEETMEKDPHEEDKDSGTGSKSSGKGNEEPEWMKNRNFDGKNPEWFVEKEFEREKAVSSLSTKLEVTEKIKNQTRRSLRNTNNVWKSTTDKVKSFKNEAMSLWKRKIAPSLGLETPERRAIAKIQKQELKHIQRTINKEKRQYKLKEQRNNNVYKPRSAF